MIWDIYYLPNLTHYMFAHGKLEMDTEEVMRCCMNAPYVITKRFHKGNQGLLKHKEDMHDVCYGMRCLGNKFAPFHEAII